MSTSPQQIYQRTTPKNTITNKPKAMDAYVGLIKVRVYRGINLPARDSRTSDPYVTVTMGDTKLKTKVVRSNCNPEWNDELTLCISREYVPIKLGVFDEDTFSKHDKIGEANIDIHSYLDCLTREGRNGPSEDGTVVAWVQPTKTNCLSRKSCIVWKSGKLVQDMTLRLENGECGEVELQIEWIDLPGSSSRGH